MKSIEEMLEEALFNGIVECQYCGYGPLEPDFEKCPSCNKRNSLKRWGLI